MTTFRPENDTVSISGPAFVPEHHRQIEAYSWQIEEDGDTRVDIPCYIGELGMQGSVRTVWFLGLGEQSEGVMGRTAARVIEQETSEGAAVVCTPHGEIIERAQRVGPAVARLLSAPGEISQHLAGDSRIILGGNSLGGLSVLCAAGDDHDRYKAVSTVSPAVNIGQGKDILSRMAYIVNTLGIQTGLQFDLRDEANWRVMTGGLISIARVAGLTRPFGMLTRIPRPSDIVDLMKPPGFDLMQFTDATTSGEVDEKVAKSIATLREQEVPVVLGSPLDDRVCAPGLIRAVAEPSEFFHVLDLNHGHATMASREGQEQLRATIRHTLSVLDR
jgi:pimeloyl-ACP methyl ester carboxylesterase